MNRRLLLETAEENSFQAKQLKRWTGLVSYQDKLSKQKQVYRPFECFVLRALLHSFFDGQEYNAHAAIWEIQL